MRKAIIEESKQRCIRAGMHPAHVPVPQSRLTPEQLLQKQSQYHEVISVVDFFGREVLSLLKGIPVMLVLTDCSGYILSLFGDTIIRSTMNQLGIVEGILMHEEEMGTNVIHLALRENEPIQLVGQDHFHQVLWESACYCVPFHFKRVNGLSGSLALMTSIQYDNPFPLTLLANMVGSMERELLLRQSSRNQTLMNDFMIRNMKNGILITDALGNITEFNQIAEKLTHAAQEEMIGSSAFAFEPFGPLIREVLLQRRKFEDVELHFNSSLQQRSLCLFDAMPIYDDSGELLGCYSQFRDITERAALERQVIISEKYSVIGKLAAGLAHEIRNPLTTVMGFIYLARERRSEMTDTMLNLIYSELETMKRLISEFVVMAKPSTPDMRSCIIEELIADTILFMDSQAKLHDCRILASLCSSRTEIRIDGMQIKQVLINLIQNAIEAMPQGGDVHVATRLAEGGDALLIQITDQGVGMTPEQVKEVLNPFFTTKESGLGLGLSICYRIIENHRGRLTFCSEPGRGTVFTVSLPIT